MVCHPLRFNEAVSGRTAVRNILVILFLAALFSVELLVIPYYYLWRRWDFPRSTHTKIVIGPEMTDWDNLYKYSEVGSSAITSISINYLKIAVVAYSYSDLL